MAQDTGFWTWPVDVAATRSRSYGLAVLVGASYAIGAVLLIASMLTSVPADVTIGGGAMVLLGLVLSFGVVGRVLVARNQRQLR